MTIRCAAVESQKHGLLMRSSASEHCIDRVFGKVNRQPHTDYTFLVHTAHTLATLLSLIVLTFLSMLPGSLKLGCLHREN